MKNSIAYFKKESNNIVCSCSLLVISAQVLGVPRVMDSLSVEGLQVVGPLPMAANDLVRSFLVGA